MTKKSIVPLEDLTSMVNNRITLGFNSIRSNNYLSAMVVVKVWLTGVGLFVVYKDWMSVIKKDFYPLKSKTYSNARKILNVLLKRLY